MRIFCKLICVFSLLLVSCQPQDGPIEPITDPVDSTKNAYRLSYQLSADSLEVGFTFLNADTNHFSEFILTFGDSALSPVFSDDAVLSHVYEMKGLYSVKLLARSESTADWQLLDSLVVNLKGWSPSLAQLTACKSVEFKLYGEFRLSKNGYPNNFKSNVISGWSLASLGGEALRRDYSSSFDKETSSEQVRIIRSIDGSTLSASHTSYYKYDGGSGYGKTESRRLGLAVTFLSEDSVSYTFRASGYLARKLVDYYRSLETRFESTTEQLVLDSINPVGEVIFYK